MKIKYKELLVPTDSLKYADQNTARWLAVEALLVSKSRNLDFIQTYFGYLSDYAKNWIGRNQSNLKPKELADCIKFINVTEGYPSILSMPKNNKWVVIENETFPLSMMLSRILSGQTKEQAMANTEVEYRIIGHSFDPLLDPAPPKSTKYISKKKLERLWAEFGDVLHYIGLPRLAMDVMFESEIEMRQETAIEYYELMQSTISSRGGPTFSTSQQPI